MAVAEGSGNSWQRRPGGVTWISCGQAGIWGVNSDDHTFFLEGTYNDSHSFEGAWSQVDGRFIQVSVGKNIVWAVSRDGKISYRAKISVDNHKGESWIETDGYNATHVSVDNVDNSVWLINNKCEIFFRTGVTEAKPEGDDWKRMDGTMKIISAGNAGVWGCDTSGKVYYREGTSEFQGKNSKGSDWIHTDGKLCYVSSGKNAVWGTGMNNEIYYRVGIDHENPSGTSWEQVTGGLRRICVNPITNDVWGLTSGFEIYLRIF